MGSVSTFLTASTVPSWLAEVITTAMIAGVVGFLIWCLQNRYSQRYRAKRDRQQLARVWGLSLYELHEAITRSLFFFENLKKNKMSHGVLYFSKTVASDYFKLYSGLSVVAKMHWMYSTLHQIQENLQMSRLTNEIREQCGGGRMIYAGAAGGFVETHSGRLIKNFNFCLQEWRTFCDKYDIEMGVSLDTIEEREDNKPDATVQS